MKKKKFFKYFVLFVAVIFFLSIPGVYFLYIFFPPENWKSNKHYKKQPISSEESWTNLSWEDIFSWINLDNLEKQVESLQFSWSNKNLTWVKK